jgi:polysaccharide biosynthesis/export protein
MNESTRTIRWAVVGAAIALLAGSLGCRSIRRGPTCPHPCDMPAQDIAPRELSKGILPPYHIEPPDVLEIDAVHVVPKAPYRLKMLDTLIIKVDNTLPDAPIAGVFAIEPGGLINFGYPYGRVKVSGLTVDEAKAAIEKHLKETLGEPGVSVGLSDTAGNQQISGQHLVTQDGTVMLGAYGSVQVIGQTLAEAKVSIERHLSKFLEDPEISIDVFAYNSKNYYVVTQGAELGDGVNRYPITGNDTVLDAISQISGLTSVSSSKIWVARPGSTPGGEDQILPVDWVGVTQRGDPVTNYQLLPGDRVYVAEDKKVAIDNYLAKLVAPMNRVFGVTLLGTATVRTVRNIHSNVGGGAGF